VKIRLDAELVRRELARSREQASDLIEARSVLVNGIPATKPATMVDAETSIKLHGKRDDGWGLWDWHEANHPKLPNQVLVSLKRP
jgi:predicted rRNA methylase YqxC with S4 and FtsJ domains